MLACQLRSSFAYANSPLKYVYLIESPHGGVSQVLGTVHAGIKLKDMPLKIMEIIASAKRLVVENNAETRSQAVQLLLEKELEKGFNSEDFDYFLWELIESKDVDWSGIISPEMGKQQFICSHFKSPISVAMLLSNLIYLPVMKEVGLRPKNRT